MFLGSTMVGEEIKVIEVTDDGIGVACIQLEPEISQDTVVQGAIVFSNTIS